jgi:NDP-sugar pyrophosphorylase family protein
VRRVVLCTGYRSDLIEDCLGDGARLGIDVIYSAERTALGTGGAVYQAREHFQAEHVLVLNGDSFCRFDLDRLHDAHHRRGALATLWLMPVEDTARYGAVAVDSQDRILAFREKAPQAGAGLISAGVYLLEREALTRTSDHLPFSLEKEFFPGLIGRGLYGLAGSGVFIDIGTPDSYQAAPEVLADELPKLAGA